MDFTIKTYKKLLNALKSSGYTFQTFTAFLENPADRVIMLRHDVDARKLNSLRFAEIQHGMGIKGTYYFRMVPQSFDAEVIRKIAEMGHEVGYHYEDMDFAAKRQKANSEIPKAKSQQIKVNADNLYRQAIQIFERNLKKLRELYPVKTICMHGSPRSPYDNKAIWKKYDYRDYGIIGEPYFDIDFNEVFYLTDTGRMWDGEKMSVRDKVDRGFNVFGSELNPEPRTQNPEPRTQNPEPRTQNPEPRTQNPEPRTQIPEPRTQNPKPRTQNPEPKTQNPEPKTQNPEPRTQNPEPKTQNPKPRTQIFHSTPQIIRAARERALPEKIMFTFHPQRWTGHPGLWLWELAFQTLKNQVKRYIVAKQKE